MLAFRLVIFLLYLLHKTYCFGRQLKDIHHPLLFTHTKKEGTPIIASSWLYDKTGQPQTLGSNKNKNFYNEDGVPEITVDEHSVFLKQCKRSCKCSELQTNSKETSILSSRSIFSNTNYLVDCSSINNFQQVAKLDVTRGKTVKVSLKDNFVSILSGSCDTSFKQASAKKEFCFPLDLEFPLLKRVKVLHLHNFPLLKSLGNYQSDFFSVMPNIKALFIDTQPKTNIKSETVNVYFSNTAQNIKDVKIMLSPNETMQFNCRSKTCFSSSFNSLTLNYSTASDLQFNSTIALPKAIKNVSVTLASNEKADRTKTKKPINVLVGSKIKNLHLSLLGGDDQPLSLLNVKVLKSFKLSLAPTISIQQQKEKRDVFQYFQYKQLREILENPPLKQMVEMTLLGASKSLNVVLPVVTSISRTRFKKSLFDTCHLAKNVMSDSNETIVDSNGHRRIYVRAFSYDLFKVVDLLETFDEVFVTAYNAYISMTFQVPRNKTVRIEYFKMGNNPSGKPTSDSSVQSINVYPANTSRFTFSNSNVRADLYKYSFNSDPIFARALSLCVVKNIGAFIKRRAGSRSSFDLEGKEFWSVGTSFPENITFSKDFGIAETAAAWESVANMNRYLQIVVQERNIIKSMSNVGLRNVENGRYFFHAYGKNILEDFDKNYPLFSNDEPATNSSKELRNKINKFQWKTLDHTYHAINVYKDRLMHVLDSHTNGRPLLYQLVSMFNKYKKEVDQSKEKLNKVTKETNSFTRAKAITVLIKALSLLFEDTHMFEHIIRTIDNDLKPEIVDNIIRDMRSVRKLVLELDAISVKFSKIKYKMESKEVKFQRYAKSLSKLIKRYFKKNDMVYNRQYKRLRAHLRSLDTFITDVSSPDQVVKLFIVIENIIVLCRQLEISNRSTVFDKVPDPIYFFNPSEVVQLYHKALNVSIDNCMKWGNIKSWLGTTLNSTNVKQMFQQLNFRYPIIDLIETAEDITQEMVSNFGYQISAIEMYMMYLVGYQKAVALQKLTRQQTSIYTNDGNSKLLRSFETAIESEKLSVKFELVSEVFLWCNKNFYKRHQLCQTDYRGINVIDSLKDLLNINGYLSQQDSNPSSQEQEEVKSRNTLFTHKVTYAIPSHCQCFEQSSNEDVREESGADNADPDRYMAKFSCAQNQIQENENRTTSSLDELQDIGDQCLNNKIKELHTFNAFTLKLDSDSFDSEFSDNKDMVMVQRIEVLLHGAHTLNRKLKLYLTSTGVYQLRVNKEIFTTFEDTLFQELAYEMSSTPQPLVFGEDFSPAIISRRTPALKKIQQQDQYQASRRSEVSQEDVSKVKSDINSFEETVNELKDSILKSDEESLINFSRNGDREQITPSPSRGFSKDESVLDDNWISKYIMNINKPLFTTWVVLVPKKNPGLNIKNVDKITITFFGSFRSYVRKNVLVL